MSDGARIEDYYARRFARLRTNKNRRVWTDVTENRAPHKPILLLCVLDLIELGEIPSNLVRITDDLTDLFARYWEQVLPIARTGNLALPFFHLQGDGFWHLVPKTGAGRISPQISLVHRLGEEVIGARLDSDLYCLVQQEKYRELLRFVLTETYFSPEAQKLVTYQSVVNRGAFVYSRKLLEHPQTPKVGEALVAEAEYRLTVRDQGFRRAVVTAYTHRCALCGVRVRTPDGHTAVAAAHILPWRETQDDRPANGLALCRMCHWVFDEGLIAVSRSYKIIASKELNVPDNLPGYLTSLKDRAIFLPSLERYWPDPESLEWHQENVLR